MNKDKIIQETKAFCEECDCLHNAHIVRQDDEIISKTFCPESEVCRVISPDAEMYMHLYDRYEARKAICEPTSRHVLAYIPITDACNFNCKICGANAKHGKDAQFVPKEEVKSRLRQAHKNGDALVNFFGGEPTLHPDILELIKYGASLKIYVGIATNGYKLGKDEEFVAALKNAGLRRVCLQFDSLNHDTLKEMGRDYLDVKLKAIEYCQKYNISFSLNSTVSTVNLQELPELFEFALRSPGIMNTSYLSLAPIGRDKMSNKDDSSVFREQVIQKILEHAGTKYGASLNDVVLLPSFKPWKVFIHPDCGASLLMACLGKDKFLPLNHIINIEKMFTKMSRCTIDNKRLAWILLVKYGIQSVRWSKLPSVLKLITGMLVKSKHCRILNFGFTNYKTLHFQDENKIQRCTVAFYTSNGMIKGCRHFGRGDKLPGSASYQQKHGLI